MTATRARKLAAGVATALALGALGGCSDTEGGTEAFCDQWSAVDEQLSSTAETSQADVEALQSDLESIDAPAEIADDIETLAEGVGIAGRLMAGDADAGEEMDERLDEFQQASERVQAFAAENCGTDAGTDEGGTDGTDEGGTDEGGTDGTDEGGG